ncbi:hypothetical protein TI04_11325 [Achromatium sp. WMS2]|nr:hypothetical protein TI04_11325 [Achromatium sp. WMS2]
MISHTNNCKCLPNAGFTIIEILIALMILSVGVLGAMSLQITAIKMSAVSGYRARAVDLSYAILDIIRASDDISAYAVTKPNPIPTCSTNLVPSGNIVEQDVEAWQNNIACSLPSGVGSITVSGRTVTVTIEWDQSREENSSSLSTQNVTMSTSI